MNCCVLLGICINKLSLNSNKEIASSEKNNDQRYLQLLSNSYLISLLGTIALPEALMETCFFGGQHRLGSQMIRLNKYV